MIFTLVTIMIWVGLSIFQTQQRTGISEELQQLALPLNPNINTEVLNRINQKRSYSPEELADFPVYRLTRDAEGNDKIVTTLPATPAPTPITAPPGTDQSAPSVASNSATPTPSALPQ